MAIREFRWILVATTALVALVGPAWAQSASAGGQTVVTWGIGLAVMGLGALIGPLALVRTGKGLQPK